MKRLWIVGITLIALQGPVLATVMSVQVREGELRNRASFLGAVVAVLPYGEQVQVKREQGPWRYVEWRDETGWIHQTALTRERIVWEAGDRDLSGAATQDELALAGRGFSAEVEGKFRRQYSEIDFRWVDYMGTLRKQPSELMAFLREGQLMVVREEDE